VDINQSNWANRSSLKTVENYFSLTHGTLSQFYEELLQDKELVDLVNEQFAYGRSRGFAKGIFGKPDIDTIDWFGFERILVYVLVRSFKPATIWETGVYYGGNSLFILRALQRNGEGSLISAEWPASQIPQGVSRHPWVLDSEDYETEVLEPGFLVPSELRKFWDLRIGSSLDLLPDFPGPCDLYLHDSDHAMQFLSKELRLVQDRMSPTGICVVDDIDWSNAFFEHCVQTKQRPLLLTDNGKDELRVRTGLTWMASPQNGDPHFT